MESNRCDLPGHTPVQPAITIIVVFHAPELWDAAGVAAVLDQYKQMDALLHYDDTSSPLTTAPELWMPQELPPCIISAVQ